MRMKLIHLAMRTGDCSGSMFYLDTKTNKIYGENPDSGTITELKDHPDFHLTVTECHQDWWNDFLAMNTEPIQICSECQEIPGPCPSCDN